MCLTLLHFPAHIAQGPSHNVGYVFLSLFFRDYRSCFSLERNTIIGNENEDEIHGLLLQITLKLRKLI